MLIFNEVLKSIHLEYKTSENLQSFRICRSREFDKATSYVSVGRGIIAICEKLQNLLRRV